MPRRELAPRQEPVPRREPVPCREPVPRPEPARRREPVPRQEPAPPCEPVTRCEKPSPKPELRCKPASAGPVVTAQLLPPALGPRKRPFDASCLPEAVRQLSTTGRLLEEVAADAFMEMDVPRCNAMAGAVLDNAKAVIARQIQPGPAVFKVGITINPIHRWHNKSHGYGPASSYKSYSS